MSKAATKGIEPIKASPALVRLVNDVITEAKQHRYSVSRVYAAYNAVFGLKETPQTCSSCLRNRTKMLADWFKGYKAPTSSAEYSMADGSVITITAECKAVRNGKGVAAGRYETEGGVIVVAPGGKSRYEAAEPVVDTKTEVSLKDGRKLEVTEMGSVIIQAALGAEWTAAPAGAYEAEGGETLNVGDDGKLVEDLT